MNDAVQKSDRRFIGQQAENLALYFLQAQGLTLLARNFHSRYGEIDLVMLDKGYVVFVEVRARKASTFLSAIESIDLRKQKKIITTSQYYLQKHSNYLDMDCRFDVIAIDYTTSNVWQHLNFENVNRSDDLRLEWLQNAYTA
ncbi:MULTISPECIES: YraN family protein [unclassified Acinetobacter]|uniref:YraN family protein n=1 Tax=unclassified Acinetobacter TaxID=196816 RepID=UPI0035B9D1E8